MTSACETHDQHRPYRLSCEDYRALTERLTRAWHLSYPPGPPPTRRRAQVLQAGRFDPVKWARLVATCERLGINPSDALREGVDLFLQEHDG